VARNGHCFIIEKLSVESRKIKEKNNNIPKLNSWGRFAQTKKKESPEE